ncbi:MAG: HAMP domain-containing histidine kinase [Chloroflexi bacterium]|nr:HAMP domain-containing histidine kinase [Chloroflexota bacterium]
MNNVRSLLWRWRHRRINEPGAALFLGLRTRLTLWYSGVLGAALLLFGVALYLGAQYFLFAPIQTNLAQHAHPFLEHWQSISANGACSLPPPPDQSGPPGPGPDSHTSPLVACFDQNGTLLQGGNNTAQLPPAFLTNTLAKTALQTCIATDIVDGGGTVGHIYRYAQAIPGPTGQGYIGVLVLGEPVDPQENALSVLLILLLSVGSVTLLGAGLGGLFLANRALVPARLAFTRQQRFIADAAHELRTPLTLLRADAEVLLRSRKRLAVEDAALLEDIVAEANHMGMLANSMLTLARLDARSQHREHEVVNLNELAFTCVRRVAAFADQKGVAVHQENSDAVFVIGDPMLLEQALLVLLDNAIKYNRSRGEVTVYTSVHAGKARLQVRDTGIGIAAEHLSHLGERFYRVDKARSREAGGTGLGLSIAHSIAALHDGTLTLTSTPDQGTTATLQLPLVQNTPLDRIDGTPGTVPLPSEKSQTGVDASQLQGDRKGSPHRR